MQLPNVRIKLPRAPWHVWFTIVSLGMLMVSINAYSDTYNFFFDKKKKGQETEESEEAVSKPETVAEDQKQTVNIPAAQSPIVIHNNNHVGNVTADQTVPIAPPPPPATPQPYPVLSSGTQLAENLERPEGRSPWKLTLSAIALAEEVQRTYTSQGVLQSYSDLEPTIGGLITLGYSFSRSVGVNVYGGLRVMDDVNTKYLAGVDLELMPFRIPISKDIDLFELGILVGGSTAMAAPGNIGSIHVGVRTNINVAKSFGVTASGRANLGYFLFEAGITARI